jgi:hypothetical protein
MDKYSKLYHAIEQFHVNLSTMPLDLLLTHTHPHQWLNEQYQTHAQLSHKLAAAKSLTLSHPRTAPPK